jgi:hypothetical protein
MGDRINSPNKNPRTAVFQKIEILDCPIEVIHRIAEYLSKPDIKNIRLS